MPQCRECGGTGRVREYLCTKCGGDGEECLESPRHSMHVKNEGLVKCNLNEETTYWDTSMPVIIWVDLASNLPTLQSFRYS